MCAWPLSRWIRKKPYCLPILGLLAIDPLAAYGQGTSGGSEITPVAWALISLEGVCLLALVALVITLPTVRGWFQRPRARSAGRPTS
jgi:hypothetical protein